LNSQQKRATLSCSPIYYFPDFSDYKKLEFKLFSLHAFGSLGFRCICHAFSN
jgi:hypothetical protein